MTLAALLEELKEVDADTWHGIESAFSSLEEMQEGDNYEVDVLKTIAVEPYAIDLLQGELQRACERREWHWLVGKDVYEEGEYRAAISIISESCISDNFDITDIAMEWGDSPTEALLAAYIAAVRAEAKR